METTSTLSTQEAKARIPGCDWLRSSLAGTLVVLRNPAPRASKMPLNSLPSAPISPPHPNSLLSHKMAPTNVFFDVTIGGRE